MITEAHHLLGRVPGARAALLRWLGSGRASFPFRYVDHAGAVVALLETYADQRMDFADACVVRMVEVESLPVFTLDVRDFSVYRIHRDHPLDLIAPDWI